MAEHLSGYVQYYENYSPVGDLTVMATCFVFFILMYFSYNIKTRNYRLLQLMVASLLVASASDVAFHMVLNNVQTVPVILIYFLRSVFHAGMFLDLFLYVVYLLEPLQLRGDRVGRKYIIVAVTGLVVLAVYEIGGYIFKYGFYIDDKNVIHDSFNVFMVAYVYYVGIVIYLLLFYRGRMVKQILYGIVGTFLVSLYMFCMQGAFKQMSFTTGCFMFPLITLLYMIHSHPYNIEIGTVNVAAFDDMINYIRKNRQERILMSLFLPEFEGTGKHYPKHIQELIRQFTEIYFRGAVLFQISNGRMVLTADPRKNPDYKESGQKMLERFGQAYEDYHLDYKIVFLKTRQDMNADNDYVRMLEYTERNMQLNSVCIVTDDVYENYKKMKYVLTQLEDIKKQGELYDPRVEVFCQPVLNIVTKKYDTAEALMRLRLPETGMVFPDVFIPLAEEHNLIHVLSRIILFKTCVMIKKLLGLGYNVQRISVNFSVSELHDTSFCNDIKSIIDDVGIPHDKIAIEITESQNDREFRIVKDRINELRDEGIKFYLDDFGTGYSNFERIMELPFDIIKFDRSLVIACGSDEKSEQMVSHLARMFSAMDYSVLYEGVETDADEEKCIRMSAKYLQGYKYSKPIPIGELKDWFDKRSA